MGSCGDCGTSRPVSSCPAPEPDSGRAFSFPAVLVLAPVCERSEASSFSPDERGSEWDKSDVRGGRKGTGGDGESLWTETFTSVSVSVSGFRVGA